MKQLSNDKLMKLWERCAAGDKEARNYLIVRHQKYADKLAKRFSEFDGSVRQAMIQDYHDASFKRLIDMLAAVLFI